MSEKEGFLPCMPECAMVEVLWWFSLKASILRFLFSSFEINTQKFVLLLVGLMFFLGTRTNTDFPDSLKQHRLHEYLHKESQFLNIAFSKTVYARLDEIA